MGISRIQSSVNLNTQSIDELMDVDTSTTPPTISQTLIWNGVNWVPSNVQGTIVGVGTLAARPIAPTADMIYTVNGDPTLNNNGVSFFYDLATTTWYEVKVRHSIDNLSDVDTTTTVPTVGQILGWDGVNWVPVTDAGFNVTVGTLAARPVAPTSDVMYILAGEADPYDNGRTFFYDFATTTWYETKVDQALMSLSDVSDTILPITGDVLTYVGTEWQPAATNYFDVTQGTIAARPVAPLKDTLYITSGEADPRNNGITFFYDVATTTWYETKVRQGIDTLTDVDTTTLAPALNNGLSWDGVNWVPRFFNEFDVTTGTLAARPLAPTNDTIYIVSGDPTTTNNGVTFLYNVATATWYEINVRHSINNLSDVDTVTLPPNLSEVLSWNGINWVPRSITEFDVTTGPFTSRPVAPLKDSLYIVSADTAQNNGRTFLYNVATTTWYETKVLQSIDTLTDVDTTTTPPTLGQYLTWNGTNWVPSSGSSSLVAHRTSLNANSYPIGISGLDNYVVVDNGAPLTVFLNPGTIDGQRFIFYRSGDWTTNNVSFVPNGGAVFSVPVGTTTANLNNDTVAYEFVWRQATNMWDLVQYKSASAAVMTLPTAVEINANTTINPANGRVYYCTNVNTNIVATLPVGTVNGEQYRFIRGADWTSGSIGFTGAGVNFAPINGITTLGNTVGEIILTWDVSQNAYIVTILQMQNSSGATGGLVAHRTSVNSFSYPLGMSGFDNYVVVDNTAIATITLSPGTQDGQRFTFYRASDWNTFPCSFATFGGAGLTTPTGMNVASMTNTTAAIEVTWRQATNSWTANVVASPTSSSFAFSAVKLTANATINGVNASPYYYLATAGLTLTMGSGAFDGQVIRLVRAADFATNTLSFAGVTVIQAPNSNLTNNDIGELVLIWDASVSSWRMIPLETQLNASSSTATEVNTNFTINTSLSRLYYCTNTTGITATIAAGTVNGEQVRLVRGADWSIAGAGIIFTGAGVAFSPIGFTQGNTVGEIILTWDISQNAWIVTVLSTQSLTTAASFQVVNTGPSSLVANTNYLVRMSSSYQVDLPLAPTNGQFVRLHVSDTVGTSTLTVQAGVSIEGFGTTRLLAPGREFVEYVYDGTSNVWREYLPSTGSATIPSFTTVTTNSTLAANSFNLIRMSGNLTVNLPAAPTGGNFVRLHVHDLPANSTLTVNGNGSTIDGLASRSLANNREFVEYVYDSASLTWREYLAASAANITNGNFINQTVRWSGSSWDPITPVTHTITSHSNDTNATTFFTSLGTGLAAGHIYYNMTSNTVRVYDGLNWFDVGPSSGTGGLPTYVEVAANFTINTAVSRTYYATHTSGNIIATIPVGTVNGEQVRILRMADWSVAGTGVGIAGSGGANIVGLPTVITNGNTVGEIILTWDISQNAWIVQVLATQSASGSSIPNGTANEQVLTWIGAGWTARAPTTVSLFPAGNDATAATLFTGMGSTISNGSIYYNNTTNKVRVYNGTTAAWEDVGAASTSPSVPYTEVNANFTVTPSISRTFYCTNTSGVIQGTIPSGTVNGEQIRIIRAANWSAAGTGVGLIGSTFLPLPGITTIGNTVGEIILTWDISQAGWIVSVVQAQGSGGGGVTSSATQFGNNVAVFSGSTSNITSTPVSISSLGDINSIRDLNMTGRGTSGVDTILTGSGSIDLSLGNFFQTTVNANLNFFTTNGINGQAQTFTLVIFHGAGTITFAPAFKWAGGTTPTFTAGRTHVITGLTYDGGATIFANASVGYL